MGREVGGCVLAVVGASGGVGASVLATAVAVRAARAGVEPVLLDGCPLGGGLDVTLGAEQQDGVRWADLGRLAGSADGRALLDRLPAVDAVGVLSFGRDPTEPHPQVASAVLAAFAAECELVVADVSAAGGSVAAAVLARADRVLVVAGEAMRQLAALSVVSRILVSQAGRPRVELAVCLRGAFPPGPVARVVEAELRWPVLCVMGDDRGVEADLLHGVAPGMRSRGSVARAADEVLAWSVVPHQGVGGTAA